jgi:hypothetical protein
VQADFARGDINVDDFKSWVSKKFENKNGFILVSNEGMRRCNSSNYSR